MKPNDKGRWLPAASERIGTLAIRSNEHRASWSPSLPAHDAAFALCAEDHEAAGLGFPLRHLGCNDRIAAGRKVDNQHRVEGLMAAGAIRCVDAERSPEAPPPKAPANVPEDVKSRARTPCRGEELLAADILAPRAPVEHAMGRAMGHQDIDVCRYQVPLLAKLCAVRRDKQDEINASIRVRRAAVAWNGGRA